jgi:hypothetical protein
MWGTKGQFLAAAVMVVVVVTPVVFVLRLLKNAIKTLKLVVCNQCVYVLLYIVKHIAIHVKHIVVWLEPKLHWSNGTLEYWVLPETSERHQDSRIIILGPQRRNK